MHLYRLVYSRRSRWSVVFVLLLALFFQPLQQVYADEEIDATAADAGEELVSEDEHTSEDEDADEQKDAFEDAVDAADAEPPVDESSEESSTSTEDTHEHTDEEDEVRDAESTDGSNDTSGVVDGDTDTSTDADESSVDTTSATGTASGTPEQSTESNMPTDDDVAGVSTSTATDTGTTSSAADTDSAATTTDTDSDTAHESTDPSVDNETVSDESSTSSDTSTVDTEPTGSGTHQSDDTAKDTDEESTSTDGSAADGTIDAEVATGTTEQVAGTSTRAVVTTVTNSANRHQFSEAQCVSVGDGSYYCQDTPVDTQTAASDEVVYAALGPAGYTDIFLQTTRETINLTNDSYEDAAPHYDQESETVVWHREIDGRHQIMSYDIRTDKMTQLTDSSVNDMQPTRSGAYIVWQRWVDGYWQVMLHDATTETSRQLTDGSVHDVAPYVRGTYVIWNTTSPGGERQLAVYDTQTELVSHITDAEGGRVSNPRFVLVYDTTFPNGDVLTRGFDPETGEVQPLSAIPSDPPPEIPSPDPVGEPRALTQQKTETPDGETIEADAEPDSESGVDDDSGNSATTTDAQADYTLDMASSTTDTTTELSEYDLVIPATTPPTSTESHATSSQSVDGE